MRATVWNQETTASCFDIKSVDELKIFFDTFIERNPFYFELVKMESKLSICIRGVLASVQYSSATNEPPYLMAVTPAEYNDDQEINFFVANQATPVSARYALPLEKAKRIIFYFWRSGERDPSFLWDSV